MLLVLSLQDPCPSPSGGAQIMILAIPMNIHHEILHQVNRRQAENMGWMIFVTDMVHTKIKIIINIIHHHHHHHHHPSSIIHHPSSIIIIIIIIHPHHHHHHHHHHHPSSSILIHPHCYLCGTYRISLKKNPVFTATIADQPASTTGGKIAARKVWSGSRGSQSSAWSASERRSILYPQNI